MAIAAILRTSLLPLPLHEQLRRILHLILDLPWLAIEAKGCIYLVEGDPPRLVMRAHAGMPQAVQSSCAHVPFGKCLCGRAIATNHVLFADRVAECHEVLYPGITPHGHYCVPIATGDRRIGLLNLYVGEGHRPAPEEERFLRAVADVLAGVIERKRVEESLRRSEERFDLAVRGTDAGIWDWDLRTDEVYYSPRWKGMLGYAEGEIGGHFAEWESRLHPEDRERAAATIRDYLEGRTAEYDLEHRLRHKDGSYRWILARGAVVRDEQGRPYRMVGSHLDITERKRVEQRLVHREARLVAARRIVRHLLPHGPLLAEGLVMRGTSFPADYAGGDYFDYFGLADGTILAVIADVSGHGIDAALVMTMTHAWLRSLARLPLEIDEIVARLNEALLEQTEEERFVTLVLVRIDPRTGALSFVNAGHPSGYLIGRDGVVKAPLDSLSLPLGLHEYAEFPLAGPLLVEPGDLVLLLSDGVYEARSPSGDLFGMERLLRVVRERLDRPIEEIIRGVRGALRQFTESGELDDDVTLLLVRANWGCRGDPGRC
jgi:PAS domain S-box-containing protein